MSKVAIRTDDVAGFFSRVKDAARKADRGEPRTIDELSHRWHRKRSAITKDVGLLERVGWVVSQRRARPGHGIEKVVHSIAPKTEMVATLG